jgi:predicted GNAT family acetyltransferase
MPGTPAAEITHDAGASRYEIRVDGEVVGHADYRRRGDVVALLHTVTDPRAQGQGLATLLVGHVLDQAREQGLSVQPFCWFVRDHIARNPQYLDLVPAANRSSFDLPERA